MNEEVIRSLAAYNQRRLQPGDASAPHPCEIAFVEQLRHTVASNIPPDADYTWFLSLKENGPGQQDPLFPWLASGASLSAMKWFLSQEAAGEAGFDDLVALTQVKMPTRAKLEMARNYWDEMGRGEEEGMHGKLLHRMVKYFHLEPTVEATLAEPLQLVNLMTALACHRRYAYLSLGALGVIEMTAPGRVHQVDRGLARLGVPATERLYFTLHATLDVKHSREWNREVIEPLPPERMREVAEGAYLRLWAGERCFARYRKELWGEAERKADG